MTNSVSPNENRKPGVFGRLRSWFFTGILVTAPVLLTVYITWAAIQLIDRQVVGLLPMLADWTALQLPGVGLVVGVVLITLIGAVAAGFVSAVCVEFGDDRFCYRRWHQHRAGPAQRLQRLRRAGQQPGDPGI